MKEDIVDKLNEVHDRIIEIWEKGQQHDNDYEDRVDKIIQEEATALQSYIDEKYVERGKEKITGWFCNKCRTK